MGEVGVVEDMGIDGGTGGCNAESCGCNGFNLGAVGQLDNKLFGGK